MDAYNYPRARSTSRNRASLYGLPSQYVVPFAIFFSRSAQLIGQFYLPVGPIAPLSPEIPSRLAWVHFLSKMVAPSIIDFAPWTMNRGDLPWVLLPTPQ